MSLNLPDSCISCGCSVRGKKKAVRLHCECNLALCCDCATGRIAEQSYTFRRGISCPYCEVCPPEEKNAEGSGLPPDLQVTNLSDLVKLEDELVQKAINSLGIRRGNKGVQGENAAMDKLKGLGLLAFLDSHPLGNKPDFRRLCLARAEVAREGQRESSTPTAIKSAKDLPKGPLEIVNFSTNQILHKALAGESLKDYKVCCICNVPIERGNSVMLTCACACSICQDCARLYISTGKNTYRHILTQSIIRSDGTECATASVAAVLCTSCRRRSYSVYDADDAIAEENRLLGNALKRFGIREDQPLGSRRDSHSTTESVCSSSVLHELYRAFVDEGRVDSSLRPNEVMALCVHNLNTSISLPMLSLELARMEAQFEREQRVSGPSTRERRNTGYLALGPLEKLHFKRNVILEAAINAPRRSHTVAAAAVDVTADVPVKPVAVTETSSSIEPSKPKKVSGGSQSSSSIEPSKPKKVSGGSQSSSSSSSHTVSAATGAGTRDEESASSEAAAIRTRHHMTAVDAATTKRALSQQQGVLPATSVRASAVAMNEGTKERKKRPKPINLMTATTSAGTTTPSTATASTTTTTTIATETTTYTASSNGPRARGDHKSVIDADVHRGVSEPISSATMSSEEVAVAAILSGMFSSDTTTNFQQSTHDYISTGAGGGGGGSAGGVGGMATGAGADKSQTTTGEKRKTVSDAFPNATTGEPKKPTTGTTDASKKISMVSKAPTEAPAKAEAMTGAAAAATTTGAPRQAHRALTESDPTTEKKLKKSLKDGKQPSPSAHGVREVVDMSCTTTTSTTTTAAAHDATSKTEASKLYHCCMLFII